MAKLIKMEKDDLWLQMEDTCDKFLNGPFQISNCVKSELLSHKAVSIGYWIDEHKKENEEVKFDYSVKLTEIDSLYIESGNIYPDLRLTHYCDAYEYFENKEEEFCKRYRDTLKKYGLRPSWSSIGINLDYFSGSHQYFGVEFSIFLRQEFCKVGTKTHGKINNPDYFFPYSCNIFNIGFRKGIMDASWAINLSPISMSYSWINIRPINFAYFALPQKNFFSWLPEAGIHWWNFYFNYAYPIVFNKSNRNLEKPYFNVKLQIPIRKF